MAALLAGGVRAQEGVVPPAEGVTADELQQIQARRRVLFQQMLADPTNLDVAFEYAGLSARAGDVEAAIATLERMLIFAPGLPRLQLELGVLYFRLGADETARYYFERAVSAPDVPEVVKARVDPYLAAIDKRTAGYTFSGTLSAGIRYQENANSGPSDRSISIQGIPFQLSEDATGQPDYNVYASANFLYSIDLQNQGDRFNINLSTYGAWYETRSELDVEYAELRAGPLFDLQRFGLDDTFLGVHGLASGVVLGGEPYLGSAGLGSNFSTLVTPRTQLVLQGAARRNYYIDSDLRPTASDRTGYRFTGSARLQHQLAKRFSIFASVTGERRETMKDYLDVWEWGGSAGWQLALPWPTEANQQPLLVSLSGGYLQRDFDRPDPTIDPTQSEVDEEVFVVGTVTLPITEGWALQAQGGYREVLSNYDTRIYENPHGSLGILKRF